MDPMVAGPIMQNNFECALFTQYLNTEESNLGKQGGHSNQFKSIF